jgi:hypothetical protein
MLALTPARRNFLATAAFRFKVLQSWDQEQHRRCGCLRRKQRGDNDFVVIN